MPFFTAFLLHIVTQDKMVDKVEYKHTYSSKKDSVKLKSRKHASSIGVTGFIIRDNMALHEQMQLIELQWRK